jgi:hypothetical protein
MKALEIINYSVYQPDRTLAPKLGCCREAAADRRIRACAEHNGSYSTARRSPCYVTRSPCPSRRASGLALLAVRMAA